MKKVTVIAHPYADQTGFIEVPDGLDEDAAKAYVQEHWNDIEFREPELDYCGTDFEVYDD